MTLSPAPGLVERLRQETRPLHVRAESSGVMAALLQGSIERPVYGALLRQLHALYGALEGALASAAAGHPGLAFTLAPPLPRREALRSDLDHLFPGDWGARFPLLGPTRDYVHHLGVLRDEAPLRLLAHAYVRYLGDLHGGQQLARIVRRRFGLPDVAGTRFYDFGPAHVVPALRLQFRAGLAAMPLDAAQVDTVVEEACSAFGRHLDLFGQLDASR